MFTTKELQGISTDYFRIFQKSPYAVTIRSKCTGHDWHILHQEYRVFKSCTIYHRHHSTDNFHLQCHTPTLATAIEEIQAHDDYHQRKLEQKQLHRKRK